MSRTQRRGAVRWVGVVLVATTALAACGGDDGGGEEGGGATTTAAETTTTAEATTTTAFDEAAAQEEVSSVITEFFALVGQGDFPAAAALIENGEEAEPRLVHCADLVKGVTVEMASVEITDPETATALFAILKDGAVLLAESGGGAVRIDGQWLVSENTFLSLYDAAKDGCTGTPPPE